MLKGSNSSVHFEKYRIVSFVDALLSPQGHGFG